MASLRNRSWTFRRKVVISGVRNGVRRLRPATRRLQLSLNFVPRPSSLVPGPSSPPFGPVPRPRSLALPSSSFVPRPSSFPHRPSSLVPRPSPCPSSLVPRLSVFGLRPSAGAPRVARRPGASPWGSGVALDSGDPTSPLHRHAQSRTVTHSHAQSHRHAYFQLYTHRELPAVMARPLDLVTAPVVQNPGGPPEGQLLPRVGRDQSLARKHELPNASANPQCQTLG